MARPAIHRMPELHAAWEDRARGNRAREIEALERQASNDDDEEDA